MRVVDSTGWIEFFSDGPLADAYLDHLTPLDEVLTPTIVLYEVFKKIKRECAPEDALIVAAQLTKTRIVDLTSALALEAADRSLDHGLAMADAIVYATARSREVELVTSDSDLAGLEGVTYLPKLGLRGNA